MADETQQTLQSSIELVKADITLLTIQTRGQAALLYRMLSRKEGNIMNVYSSFIELFFQLFLMFKGNARQTNKIDDWNRKEKILHDLFYNDILRDGKIIPNTLLQFFDLFLDDLIKCGIYNLTMGEFIGKGDL